MPCGITETFSNGLVDSKSVPLGWTPIIGLISLIGQLHGTYTQYDSCAAMTPAIKPKNPIAMLANVPFHVAIHNCSGIMASDTIHAVRLAAKILNHGILPHPVMSPDITVAPIRTNVDISVWQPMIITFAIHK